MSDFAIDAASRSRQIHEQLSHPIIDGDGHWLESFPIFLDYLREVGGKSMADDFTKSRLGRSGLDWYGMTPDERQSLRRSRPSRWGFTPDPLDRATVSIPGVLYDRLDAFGIDFGIIYPTMGLQSGVSEKSADLRRAVCRAHNTMSAEMFADYSDRLTPVAVIPMVTPEEAIEEAEFVVKELGLKAAMILGTVQRPIPAYSDLPNPPTFIDSLALDSVYDYEPVWQKWMELGLAVTTHSGSMGWGDRRSPSTQCFNHIGHFAQANHTFARAVFFAGVTYRYPKLNFLFLEGGVGWARCLLNDLVEHWHVRSNEALERMRPDNMDPEEMVRLFKKYGGKQFGDRAEELLNYLDKNYPGLDNAANTQKELDVHGGKIVDDFEAAHIVSSQDVYDRFDNYYFGCEADDRMTVVAYDPRFKGQLKPVYGSDVGHFDVAVLTDVLYEAHELVDHGLISEEEFKSFTFGNVAKLHGGMNPNFFKGTIVENAVAAHLGALTA